MARLGVLISGRGTNLQSILDAVREGRLQASVAVVISNRADAAGLERASRAGVETLVLDHQAYGSREAYDADSSSSFKPPGGFDCLAGFMRILSQLHPRVSQSHSHVHPSLLPAFPGVNPPYQAWEHGVRISGAPVHLVDDRLTADPS